MIVSCSKKETAEHVSVEKNDNKKIDGNDQLYIQIENTRLSLRYSRKADVEALLGKPEEIIFPSQSGEDSDWNNLTFWAYEKEDGNSGNLRFWFNEEGAIVKIIAGSTYRKNILIFGKALAELKYADIANSSANDFTVNYKIDDLTVEGYKFDPDKNPIYLNFRFYNYDKPETWFDLYYKNTWKQK
jgi:hypothetical protein